MEKSMNNKVDALRNEAENQEELMKSLAQIDEEGQLSDDVLDAVSGGRGSLSNMAIGLPGIPTTAGMITTPDETMPLKL